MRFTPKEIKENINISKISPIGDFFELVLKVLGILLLIYIALGFLVDYIAPRISVETERKLSRLFSAVFDKREQTEAEKKMQLILDKLTQQAQSLPEFDYKVHIRESNDINAYAFPGGHIVVLSALLKQTEFENELAMVLAHELGHFIHRDHLRGLGRSLVFLIISTVLFGADSSVSKFITNSLSNAEMRFSQAQERAADIYALDLLNKTYGHVRGAIDFYEKMGKKEKVGRFFYIFASHPYPKSRILMLKERIKTYGYKMGEKIPLDIQ